MNKISTIKIKKKTWDKTPLESRLEVNFEGKNINHTIINSIKRAIQSYIPIHAFTQFTINKNNSIFNNNFIKQYIRNLPVLGIKNTEDIYVPPKIKSDEDIFDESMGIVNDNIDMNVDKNINSSSLNQLTMYLDYKNKENDIVTVTTDDAQFYVAENKIKSPYLNPVPLIKLQPKQSINMSAVSSLGTEEINPIFSPVSICSFKENKDNNYTLILESLGQITEKRIIIVALINLIQIIDNLIKIIPDNKGMKGKIEIPDADHTIGNILSDGMSLHSAVAFSGYNMPHPLDKKIIVHYKLKSGNLKKVLKDVLLYYQNIFTKLKSGIEKLS